MAQQSKTNDARYRWVCVNAEASFAPRDGAGALTFRNKMWLLGGWNPRDMTHFPRMCNNEVWSSENGCDWVLEKPNTFHSFGRTFKRLSDWAGRHCSGYVVYKDKMWIVGGDANQGHYHNDVWNSDDGRVWHYVNNGKPVPWRPRCHHHTVVFNDRILVMGGQTSPQFAEAEEKFYNDVWSTSDGINWEKIETQGDIWTPRGLIGGSAVLNERIWMLGGGTYDTPTTPERKHYNDVWSSGDGARWTLHTANAPWASRSMHDVAAFDGKLWVLEGSWAAEGQRSRNQNDVWYSSDGVNWTELPGTPWKPRHAASVFVHDNALWMVAGNNMESDVWKLVRVPD